MHLTMARIRHITDAAAIVGEAVLVNYPLRLWLRELAHHETLSREFHVLLAGHRAGVTADPPQMLLDIADLFTTVFGPIVDTVFAERRRALDAGLDRVDSRVPLVHRTPDLLDYYREVLHAVDLFCEAGQLLTLKRPPMLVALADWTLSELTSQYYGAPPTPWAGPF